MGDMNIDILEHSSSLNKLTELCGTLGLQNLIRVGTCCNILKAYPISADTDSKAVSHLGTFFSPFFFHTNSSTGP